MISFQKPADLETGADIEAEKMASSRHDLPGLDDSRVRRSIRECAGFTQPL
jgi:hypothetical protein